VSWTEELTAECACGATAVGDGAGLVAAGWHWEGFDLCPDCASCAKTGHTWRPTSPDRIECADCDAYRQYRPVNATTA